MLRDETIWTIGDVSPYIAAEGALARYVHFYLGWRCDEINFNNEDLLVPAHSFQYWVGVNNPKATVSFLAKDHSWLPKVSLSGGEAFFTNDPRIGSGTVQGSLISRSHSYQLVASKTLAGTDFRLTLGHTTTEATLAKVDPDTGLQFDEGPGRLRYLTFAARHYFGFGMLQGSVSKADAWTVSDGTPTPEAPRLIVDGLATLDMIARGYTGQTTEQLEFMSVVGVRLRSYASVSFTYHFGRDYAAPH